jgi:voltage-gated potassium channel
VTRQIIREPHHSTSYEIFILVLTLLSLGVMGLLLLPLNQATIDLLTFYDNLICFVFLFDFALNISGTRPRREYFIYRRGWLDLLGSIPTFGLFRYAALLRLARLSRLARISRLLRGQKRKELVTDILQNRGSYATFITILAAMIVLVTSSTLVLQFEAAAPDANITTGGDALWWSVVTITTVGYGDKYPVTLLGRLSGVFVMFAGVGIIGSLASILASLLVPPAPSAEGAPSGEGTPVPAGGESAPAIAAELASIREELASLRRSLAPQAGARQPPSEAGDSPPMGPTVPA